MPVSSYVSSWLFFFSFHFSLNAFYIHLTTVNYTFLSEFCKINLWHLLLCILRLSLSCLSCVLACQLHLHPGSALHMHLHANKGSKLVRAQPFVKPKLENMIKQIVNFKVK